MAKEEKYTVEPGRWIYRRGEPFFALMRYEREPFVSPSEVDDMARLVAHLLNQFEAGVLRLPTEEQAADTARRRSEGARLGWEIRRAKAAERRGG